MCARVLECRYFLSASSTCEKSGKGKCSAGDCDETKPTNNTADNRGDTGEKRGSVFISLLFPTSRHLAQLHLCKGVVVGSLTLHYWPVERYQGGW